MCRSQLRRDLLILLLVLLSPGTSTQDQGVCGPGTVASVQQHFADQLQICPVGSGCAGTVNYRNSYATISISDYTNETAWQYLGCIPNITVLTLTSSSLKSVLPAQWGLPGMFPQLQWLTIQNTNLTGTLPEAWGLNNNSFPQLTNLTFTGNPLLEGPLPASWGSRGSFPKLEALTIYSKYPGDYVFPKNYVVGGFTSNLPLSWGGPNSFPSLQTLNLFGLNIIGSLPEQWSCSACFQNLRILQVTGNPNLTGTLPANWSAAGSFPSLQLLNLANASLMGSIPQTWTPSEAFPSLLYLSLANTTLTGSLPSFHNQLLQVLDVSFSTFGGNISGLWSSTSPLAAISINAVPITGAFPPARPAFFGSLQVLIVDNTSMNSTIPTSWLEVANARTALSALDLHNFMHNISFSGLQFWLQSWEDPAWWADVCSSVSKLSGYGLTNTAVGNQLYAGIANLADLPLDVTLLQDGHGQYLVAPTPELPSSEPSDFSSKTKYYFSYYFRIKRLADFELDGPYSPGKASYFVLSAAGQCPNQHRYKCVLAAWGTFGALLVGVALGYVLWVLLIRRHPGLLTVHALSDSTWNRILLCWHIVPLLGLGLYLYDLISDVEVVQAVWGLGGWYGKSMLSILICHYILRGMLVTVHLSLYHGKGRLKSALQFGLTLLCIPIIVPAVLIMDVLSCFEFLHIPFGPINPQGYREMRGILMPILQSLPNVIVTTIIFSQGSSPLSLGFFRSIDLLQYNDNPQFLSRSLYLQAAITSFGSILWGIGELYHISHMRQERFAKLLSGVVTGSCLKYGRVKIHLQCQDQQKVQLKIQIV